MKINKKQIFSMALTLILLLPNISLAVTCTRPDGTTYENKLNLCYPAFGGFELELETSLNKVVAWFYYFIVSIAGLAAFFMLVWGGFEWMTSAGNPARISSAKDRISSALLGLLLILASFLILQVINPELTILPQLP